MSISSLLYEAAVLMLVGMIVVFIFLTILIFATKGLSKFVASLPANSSASSTTVKLSPVEQKNQAPEPVVAAITVAIQQYKKNNK
jgi:oxaloacetate decarboxylase (Na+ extruding) subunit gamma